MVIPTTAARRETAIRYLGRWQPKAYPAVEPRDAFPRNTEPDSGFPLLGLLGFMLALLALVLLPEGSPLRVEAIRFVVEGLVSGQSDISHSNLLLPFRG
ncbi:MAG: hypothetical protein OXD34_08315 [bacterium]|nr:hypothetical protein [bacterium]